MDSKCQSTYTVYDCHITSPEPQKIYFGLAEAYKLETSINL